MIKNEIPNIDKTYYENGKVLTETETKNGKKDGAFTGYYYNGAIKTKGVYKNDKKHGEWIYYSSNQEMEKYEVYKDGERHGRYVYTYNSNGVVKEVANYVRGDKDRYHLILKNGSREQQYYL